MKRTLQIILIGLMAVSASAENPTPPPKTVRVAVINGMMMTGLWPKITEMFEAESGYKIELAATGERPALDNAFRQGHVDLITMHSGDITTRLVADGYATNMRPWALNELVIVGPKADPAGVRGWHDGVAALKKISTSAKFVDFNDIGSREVVQSLWQRAGLDPRGAWFLKDESENKFEILQFARSKQAYVVVGRIPARMGRMPSEGMEVMVEGDPAMRRPYLVMEANPQKVADANVAGARALSDFLMTLKVQKFLSEFGSKEHGGLPFFYPIAAGEH
jgi:tungstate transport system substrate-binding protein